jgi:hypothetical protein
MFFIHQNFSGQLKHLVSLFGIKWASCGRFDHAKGEGNQLAGEGWFRMP